MPNVISWQALDHRDGDFIDIRDADLPLGDRILLSRVQSLPAEQVEFVFSNDPAVDWWKELKILDSAGNVLGLLSAEGRAREPSRIQFSLNELAGVKLVLSKAMMFGVHTEAYEIQDLPVQGGVSYHFFWSKQ
jgi:hypothetical protein